MVVIAAVLKSTKSVKNLVEKKDIAKTTSCTHIVREDGFGQDLNSVAYITRRKVMATQAFKRDFEATEQEIDEAEELMDELEFKEDYLCSDGYESWTSSRDNMDSFVELVRRARLPVIPEGEER